MLLHVSVRVQRTGSRPYDVTIFLCVSAHAVAWSPLAHAPHKCNPCQVDNSTFPSVADGTAPGSADDLVRPEVPDAFLAGRTECIPTLWFCDDQDGVGLKKNTLSINTSFHET